VDVFEALGDALEAAAAGGIEVDGIYLVDDGVLPPDVGVHAGADPAGAGEGLGFEWRSESGSEKGAGEAEGEEPVWSECNHAFSYLRCYARRFVSGIDVLCAAMTMQELVFACMRAGGDLCGSLCWIGVRFYGSKEKGDFA
jgi:hypothetical protein